MPDNHSPAVRSYNMSRIKNSNTKPEEMVRKYLFSKHMRYRKCDKRYPGKPDIVLPKYNTVIFINGCFWHWHKGCPGFVMPKSRLDYWKPKLKRNRIRDAEHIAALQADGWHVITVWECELKKEVRDERLIQLYKEIISNRKNGKVENDLLANIKNIHTTKLGENRIKKNLSVKMNNVVNWCIKKVKHADKILRKGKNWYVYSGNSCLTINADNYTIITAHVTDEKF